MDPHLLLHADRCLAKVKIPCAALRALRFDASPNSVVDKSALEVTFGDSGTTLTSPWQWHTGDHVRRRANRMGCRRRCNTGTIVEQLLVPSQAAGLTRRYNIAKCLFLRVISWQVF